MRLCLSRVISCHLFVPLSLGNFRPALTCYHRRVHDPAIRLPCCACAIAHICVLGFFTTRRMDIPTVCQPFRLLTRSQTKYCSTKNLDNFPSTVTKQDHLQSIFETILFNEDVCRHDAVILVDHQGVCALLNSRVLRLSFEIA